jgi:M-phase inducer tyrosine phosphatase
MFENPGDVMKQQQEEPRTQCSLQSVMDMDENPPLQLPHFFKDDESIPRITKTTMIELLDGKYNECYDKSMVVDCRFEYEYKGGHIEGAVNFNNKEELASQLFKCSSPEKTIVVFHCEYSAHRAPLALVSHPLSF